MFKTFDDRDNTTSLWTHILLFVTNQGNIFINLKICMSLQSLGHPLLFLNRNSVFVITAHLSDLMGAHLSDLKASDRIQICLYPQGELRELLK